MSKNTLTVYGYMKCSTCRKAIKWLEAKGRAYDFVDITEHPPSVETLRTLLEDSDYTINHLYNSSGEQYRQLKLSRRKAEMTEPAQLELLASNGRLIKRPIVTDGTHYTVGFKEDEFAARW